MTWLTITHHWHRNLQNQKNPDEKMKTLTGYLYEASDSPQYIGEYYVMPPDFMKGKIQTIMVGAQSYRFEMNFNTSELWYGKPSSGDIVITLHDGSVYKSGNITIPESEGETPEPNDEKVNALTDYLYEASDSPQHLGEYYVMPPGFMKGKIKTIMVGVKPYRFVMSFNTSELWYGKPSSGVIVITLSDGSVYRSDKIPGPIPPPLTGNIEHGDWFGRHNNDRGTWYFNKLMNQYPSQFYLTVPGCLDKRLVENNGHRWELGGQQGYVIKQSEVSGRGMALIVPRTCRSTEAFIEL